MATPEPNDCPAASSAPRSFSLRQIANALVEPKIEFWEWGEDSSPVPKSEGPFGYAQGGHPQSWRKSPMKAEPAVRIICLQNYLVQ